MDRRSLLTTPITRRAALLGVAASTAVLAVPASALMAPQALAADERIAAAIAEIQSALAEKYPGWRLEVKNEACQPIRNEGSKIKLAVNRHMVMIFATQEKYGPEEPRWFVNFPDPAL